MRKIVSFVLAACIILSLSGSAFAENSVVPEWFVKVKIPFPDKIKDYKSWLTRARYKDSGEIIPLSMFYENCVHATIPVEYKDKELEAFVQKELEFTDYDASNPDFHDFIMLSGVGVIRGNDKGEAQYQS